jgi:hypothetical protein
MQKEDEEEYLAYCSDAMFRIHILELRLNRSVNCVIAIISLITDNKRSMVECATNKLHLLTHVALRL